MSFTLFQDTFQRTNVASGWGTATDGHPWTTIVQTAGTSQVSGNVGQVSNNGGNGTNFLIGSASRTDVEILVQTSLTNASAASHQILRLQDVNNYYYAGQDQNGVLAIKIRVNNVGSSLATAANVITANQKYWIRFRAQGSTLSLRFWQDGTTEPGTWNLQVTDTTYTGGAIGYRGTNISGSDTINVYSYQAVDLTSTAQNQLVVDTFTRTNQSGWGNSSDGELWVPKDANATYSIVSNRGQATSFTASSNTVFGGTAQYDTDMTMRFSVSVPATDGVWFIARWTSANNFYFIGFVQNSLVIRKLVSGAQTNITSVAFTVTTSTNYWLHVLVQGTNLKVKAWQDGSGEPTAWGSTTIDSSLTEGNPGMRVFGGASDIVLVDSLTINDPNVALVSSPSNVATLSGTLTPPAVALRATFVNVGLLTGVYGLGVYLTTIVIPHIAAAYGVNGVDRVVLTAPYAVNGTVLDSQPTIVTAPDVMSSLVEAGSSFMLIFNSPSTNTQNAFVNGSVVNIQFTLTSGQPIIAQVQVASTMVGGTSFQVTCTVLQTVSTFTPQTLSKF